MVPAHQKALLFLKMVILILINLTQRLHLTPCPPASSSLSHHTLPPAPCLLFPLSLYLTPLPPSSSLSLNLDTVYCCATG